MLAEKFIFVSELWNDLEAESFTSVGLARDSLGPGSPYGAFWEDVKELAAMMDLVLLQADLYIQTAFFPCCNRWINYSRSVVKVITKLLLITWVAFLLSAGTAFPDEKASDKPAPKSDGIMKAN